MNLEQKIRALSPKEFIMAMVNGLRNPLTQINMGSFGHVEGTTCFGCAATNAIGNIYGSVDLLIKHKSSWGCLPPHTDVENTHRRFLSRIEDIYDFLRCGGEGVLYTVNEQLAELGMFQIEPKPSLHLPRLTNDYTLEDLKPYIELAEYQEE